MSKTRRDEGVILRSLRYGEADRILHVYTAQHGRVNAIARGARKTSSRLGGRLEPLNRVQLDLHRGRGDLQVVTGAQMMSPQLALRESLPALIAGSQGAAAVLKLMGEGEANPAAYNLLCRYLAVLDARARVGRNGSARAAGWPGLALGFRLKLLVAAGFAPRLGPCAGCGEAKPLGTFSAPAGGAVCDECRSGGFALDGVTLELMRDALARPLTELDDAAQRPFREADRAVVETLAYHAHVRLRPL